MAQSRDWQWLVDKQKAAEELEREGQYIEAIRAYSEIVNRDPAWGNGWAFLALAELYEKMNQMDLAETCLVNSVEQNIDPPNPNYRSNCAAFLLARGKAARALEFFWQALEAAVAIDMEATVPDIISGIRKTAEQLPIPKDEVEAKIKQICRDTA